MAQAVGYVDVAARNISMARPRSGYFIMAIGVAGISRAD